MKVGDLVRHRETEGEPGLVVDTTQKKVWRTALMGKKVSWGDIEPEPHAVVLWSHNDGTVDIPIVELELVNEVS